MVLTDCSVHTRLTLTLIYIDIAGSAGKPRKASTFEACSRVLAIPTIPTRIGSAIIYLFFAQDAVKAGLTDTGETSVAVDTDTVILTRAARTPVDGFLTQTTYRSEKQVPCINGKTEWHQAWWVR